MTVPVCPRCDTKHPDVESWESDLEDHLLMACESCGAILGFLPLTILGP